MTTHGTSDAGAAQLARLSRALSHPLRVQIVRVILLEGETSPLELVARVGTALPNVSYHVRYLVRHGILEFRRGIPRRGAVAHYYDVADMVREPLRVVLESAVGEAKNGSDPEGSPRPSQPAPAGSPSRIPRP